MLPITVNTAEEGGLCPVRQVLANVTGKWQSLILLALEDGPARFSGIRRLIGDITQRVLTENLRALERDGYLTRTVLHGPPVEVHYTLTPLGEDMVAHFKPLVEFAARNHGAVVANRARYDAGER
ncbi:MAG TPA: helix-turn-helix domain-containing protein [Rhizobiaceae bacterium]|nr:helix-turn-helix domain-containing protein [Rhizobiaceae bacterium]